MCLRLFRKITLNQPVGGSSPPRLTGNPIQNPAELPPWLAPIVNNGLPILLTKFLKSRRTGISPRTIEFYEYCLESFVESYYLTPDSINQFLANLTCGNAKHAYFRSIRAFCNWAHRNDYIQENPIKKVDSPTVSERVLPSLSPEQVNHLITTAENLRDKCVISLFADSGMRLSELASITKADINWRNYTILIVGKGNKQRRAPFTKRTAKILKVDAHSVINLQWPDLNRRPPEPHL